MKVIVVEMTEAGLCTGHLKENSAHENIEPRK